jgi:hypothetical protein
MDLNSQLLAERNCKKMIRSIDFDELVLSSQTGRSKPEKAIQQVEK